MSKKTPPTQYQERYTPMSWQDIEDEKRRIETESPYLTENYNEKIKNIQALLSVLDKTDHTIEMVKDKNERSTLYILINDTMLIYAKDYTGEYTFYSSNTIYFSDLTWLAQEKIRALPTPNKMKVPSKNKILAWFEYYKKYNQIAEKDTKESEEKYLANIERLKKAGIQYTISESGHVSASMDNGLLWLTIEMEKNGPLSTKLCINPCHKYGDDIDLWQAIADVLYRPEEKTIS